MTRAAQHYSVGAREIKHLASLLRCFDITIREDRNAHGAFDVPDRLVLGLACIKIRARAAMNSERLDAGAFRDLCDPNTITIVTIPPGADLQRDWYAHRLNHGRENFRHECFILQ